MDLTVNRTALVEELQLLQGVVERRTTIPILSNILLTTEGDRLNLAATDLDVTLFTRCQAAIRSEGRATIQGKVFFDLVRSLPSDEVRITAAEGRVEVASGSFNSHLAGLDPADFPTLPEIPAGQGFAVPVSLLHQLIDRSSYAVSSEEGHLQYNAALLVLAKDRVEMVGTDGHRLAYVQAPHEAGEPPFKQQLLPRKVLNQLRKLPTGEDGNLFLSKGDNHLAFRLGERVLLSRILEARFPQYERVLVRDNPNRVRLARRDLVASLRRVSLLTSERTHGVQLQVGADGLALTSVGFDLGQASERIAVTYSGAELTVFLNAQYVMDFLGAVEADDVELQLRDADSPVVLVPAGEDATSGECLYVIMPIRL